MNAAAAIQWIIPIAGLAAVAFAGYLARNVLRRDTGTDAMRDVASTINEGAVAFIRRQYTTIAVLAVVGSVVIGLVIFFVETKDVADVPSLAGLPIALMTAVRLPGRRRVLDGLGHHRHVHQRQVERPHRGRGAAQPGRGGPGRDARRRRLRLPRRRASPARRVGHLHPVRDARGGRDRRTRRPS